MYGASDLVKLDSRSIADKAQINWSTTSSTLHQGKRPRYRLDQQPVDVQPTAKSPSSEFIPPQQTLSSLLLRPCHICHRRPTSRAMLDAYADCDRCHERACYICLRECEGSRCTLSSEDLRELAVLEDACGEKLDILDRRKKRQICGWCVVEGLDGNGNDVIRCLDCFDIGRNALSHSGLPLVTWMSTKSRI